MHPTRAGSARRSPSSCILPRMTRPRPLARGLLASIVLALGALAACGGKVVVDGQAGAGGSGGQGSVTASSSTGSDPLQEAACTKYCASAGEKGCPGGGDCQARCLAMFVDGCVPQITTLLSCTPPSLGTDCLIELPNNEADCPTAVGSAINCLTSLAGFTCVTDGSNLGVNGACFGTSKCDIGELSIKCDSQGTCTCAADGQVVGTCKNLIAGADFCSVRASCCTPLFTK
jgi:hypothetical protein